MAGLEPSSLIAVLTGSSIYTAMLPPLAEVRRAQADSATARDVRCGIAMASAALIGSGLVIGVTEGSARPVALTLVLAILMGGIYEVTLRHPGEPCGPPVTGSAPARARWS